MKKSTIIHQYHELIDNESIPVEWVFSHPHNLTTTIKDKILTERNIERKSYTMDDIFEYLDNNIHNLPNIDAALDNMKIIINNKIPVGIIGDYDVDGICSTALIYTFFKRINHPAYFFIGDRKDGYGPTTKGFDVLRKQGAQSFIILDSGSVAKDVLEKEEGIIIVLDHHIPDSTHQPKNAIVVNPQIDNHPMAHCCTGGLVFAFIYGIKKMMNFIMNLENLLTIAGITTVCDVMHLSPLNTMYIQYTTKLIQNHNWPYIFDFLMVNKMIKKINLFDEEDLGFLIGPHINSIGRLCSNKYIHQLVQSIAQDNGGTAIKKKISLIDESDAYKIALDDEKISEFIDLLSQQYFPLGINDDDYNKEEFIEYMGSLMMNLNIIRKQRQQLLSEEINNAGDVLIANRNKKVFGFCSHLPESFLGVVGIVSAKVCESFYKPSFIGIKLKDKIKGSIRSIEGVNIGLMMIAAKKEGIIIDGGGHAKAGGFTVYYDKWENFLNFAHNFTHEALSSSKKKTFIVDYIMNVNGINNNLLDDMAQLKPFGEGNPKLQILLVNCIVKKIAIIKQIHLMINLELPIITHYKKSAINGWCFFFDKKEKFKQLVNIINKHPHSVVDLLVHVGLDKTLYIIDYRINGLTHQKWL